MTRCLFFLRSVREEVGGPLAVSTLRILLDSSFCRIFFLCFAAFFVLCRLWKLVCAVVDFHQEWKWGVVGTIARFQGQCVLLKVCGIEILLSGALWNTTENTPLLNKLALVSLRYVVGVALLQRSSSHCAVCSVEVIGGPWDSCESALSSLGYGQHWSVLAVDVAAGIREIRVNIRESNEAYEQLWPS